MQKNLIIITLLTLSFLMGCEPHRIDIQQGNRIKSETLAKLKVGMNRKQVLFLLGSPLLKDSFHEDRWDYIYYLKPGNDPVRQSRITLYFDGDTLVKIDDSAFTPEAYETQNTTDGENVMDSPVGGGGGGHSH